MSFTGRKHSPETIAKMTGRKRSPETIAKMTGRKLSPETIAKIRAHKMRHIAALTPAELADYATLKKAGYKKAEALIAIGRADLVVA